MTESRVFIPPEWVGERWFVALDLLVREIGFGRFLEYGWRDYMSVRCLVFQPSQAVQHLAQQPLITRAWSRLASVSATRLRRGLWESGLCVRDGVELSLRGRSRVAHCVAVDTARLEVCGMPPVPTRERGCR